MLYAHIMIVLMSVLLGISRLLKTPELLFIARLGLGITSSTMATGNKTVNAY